MYMNCGGRIAKTSSRSSGRRKGLCGDSRQRDEEKGKRRKRLKIKNRFKQKAARAAESAEMR